MLAIFHFIVRIFFPIGAFLNKNLAFSALLANSEA